MQADSYVLTPEGPMLVTTNPEGDVVGIVDEPVWMSTPAAADYLGISTQSLYRFINLGLVTAYRIGRVIRLKRQHLDDYLESTRIQPGELAHLVNGGEVDG